PGPSQIINPDGSVRSFTYNAFGQQTSLTDEEGNVIRAVYDRVGRLTQSIDGEGKLTQYLYVGNRLDHQISPAGNVTRYEYDEAGARTAEGEAGGGRGGLTGDPDGRVPLVAGR